VKVACNNPIYIYKVKFSLYLISEDYTMKAYGGMEVWLHLS
jgi:hypothetical protein